MNEFKNPTLIVICGWPICGKGTVAELISKTLKIHWIDIDSVRVLNFGLPNPYPNASEEAMERDRAEMKGSYDLLYAAIDANSSMKRSLIVTATFSRAKYWEPVLETLKKYSDAELKIIWCRPKNDSDKEINRRLKKRVFGKNCFSSVNSLERYHEVKNRYEPITPPHCEIDTSPPNTAETSVLEAIGYILS